jgi:hypothetical protein
MLKHPIVPREPADRPAHRAPCAWAASSMTWTSPAAFAIAGTSAIMQAQWTTMTAATSSSAATAAASMHPVAGSTSARTGTSPALNTALALAVQVSAGTSTGSP